MKLLHVYLGRFAPFHEGHKMLLGKLIDRFGVENCLVLIGSANVVDDHTPYTFEQRAGFVKKHFPGINILPLNDVNNDDEWIKNIKKIENRLGVKFVFYGGSSEDLKILSTGFKTCVLVDRFTEGKGISATQIRSKLRQKGLL